MVSRPAKKRIGVRFTVPVQIEGRVGRLPTQGNLSFAVRIIQLVWCFGVQDANRITPSGSEMPVSYENSKAVFEGIRAAGIRSISALPETWLGLLLQRAEEDPEIDLIQVAKEEEAIGIAAGAYFAGEPHMLLMQNHGFLGAINGVVSLAQLYGIPLCMLIALRGHWGEPYPWHTRGGIVTEEVLRALSIPFEYARDPDKVATQIREAYTFSQSSLSPVALLLTRNLMED